MSNLPAPLGASASIRYPEFQIPVPWCAQVEPLVAAAASAHELAIKAHFIALWLGILSSPFPSLSPSQTAESLLGHLPEDVDQRIFECDRLVAPLRLELVNPSNCFSEGEFHAPCAHDAVLRYARDVRQRLDLIARIATKRFESLAIGEVLAGSVLRGHWDEIVRVCRETLPDRFQGLPSLNSLLTRLTAEATAAINARIRATGPEVLPQKRRDILTALNGRVLRLKALAQELDDSDPSRLHRDHIKPLINQGRLKHDRKVGGYYRPDAPPTMA